MLFVYEYAITLSQEVELIWSRRWTGPSALFILNRLGMAMQVSSFVLYQLNWTTPQSCESGQVWYDISVIFSSTVWAVFSALRTYALGDRSWILTMSVFIPAMFSPLSILYITTTYDSVTVYRESESLTMCVVGNNWSATLDDQVEITTRAINIFVDVIIVLVTWRKTYTTTRMAREANTERPLARLLLQDGTIYFVALLLLNIAILAMYLTDTVFVDGPGSLTTTLEPIIIARFFLDLRKVDGNQNEAARAYTGSSRLSTLHFASRVIGNMGGELHGSFGIYPDDLEGEEDDAIGGVDERNEGDEGAGDALVPTENAEIMEISRV